MLTKQGTLCAAMLMAKYTMTHFNKVGLLAGAEANILPFDDRQVVVDYARWVVMEKRYTGE